MVTLSSLTSQLKMILSLWSVHVPPSLPSQCVVMSDTRASEINVRGCPENQTNLLRELLYFLNITFIEFCTYNWTNYWRIFVLNIQFYDERQIFLEHHRPKHLHLWEKAPAPAQLTVRAVAVSDFYSCSYITSSANLSPARFEMSPGKMILADFGQEIVVTVSDISNAFLLSAGCAVSLWLMNILYFVCCQLAQKIVYTLHWIEGLAALSRGQVPTTGLNFITNRKFMTKLGGKGGNGVKYPVCYS